MHLPKAKLPVFFFTKENDTASNKQQHMLPSFTRPIVTVNTIQHWSLDLSHSFITFMS